MLDVMQAHTLMADLRKSYFKLKDASAADADLFLTFLKHAKTYIKTLAKEAESTPAGKRWFMAQLKSKAALRTFYESDFVTLQEHFSNLLDIYNKQETDKFCKKLLLELEKLIQSGYKRYI